MRRVQIESKRRIFNDFFKIEEAVLRYERFDGKMTEPVRRLTLERGDAVAAIIIDKTTERLVLINQFRFPTYEKGPGWITEVVAGIVDGNEAPEEAIRREIREEAGYEVSSLTHICTFYVSPGGSSERIVLYCAEVEEGSRVSVGGGLASEHEDIQVLELSLQDALEALESGAIADAKTIIALNWLRGRAGRAPSSRAPSS